ncbi:hypothetical protein GCM10011613_32570 [Cellvibrio zantedeschiae]|uniref:Flagella basal body P-ring formation protein FlgA n=1 Tax=Cellvibrio zantedeschiae TaxID=1237077 RepID=A0ABQ3BBT7_9GAMM|nr:flagellar basal body P-ring formation chaperone FlgA [Cellvibrio zantedeschiae]GGY84970.1 hypothetical protein GCM10011613_32570 [Cellvibrio zantedeschiae]
MLRTLGAVIIGGIIDCSGVISHMNSSNRVQTWEVAACKNLPRDYKKASISPLKLTETDAPDSSDVTQIIVSSPLQGRFKVVWVEARENKQKVKSTVNVAFELYKDVWTFAKDQNAGAIITSDAVILKTVNVAPFFGVRNFSESNIVGKRLTKRSSKGQIIFSEHLSSPLLLERNTNVKAVLIDSGLKIEMDAISLEDVSAPDQKIKIRILTSGVILTGTLREKDTIYVEN